MNENNWRKELNIEEVPDYRSLWQKIGDIIHFGLIRLVIGKRPVIANITFICGITVYPPQTGMLVYNCTFRHEPEEGE